MPDVLVPAHVRKSSGRRAYPILRPPPLPAGPYDVIYIDWPWEYEDALQGQTSRGAKPYPGIPLKPEYIDMVPVHTIASKDCAMFMWVTGPFIVTGEHLKLLDAWGFKAVTMAFVWVKLWKGRKERFWLEERDIRSGTGHWTNQNAEFCVFARRGNVKPKSGVIKREDRAIKQVCMEDISTHSRKPVEVRRRIERLLNIKGKGYRCLEMFARTSGPLWDHWGVVVCKKCHEIFDSLERMEGHTFQGILCDGEA